MSKHVLDFQTFVLTQITDPLDIALLILGKRFCLPGCGHRPKAGVAHYFDLTGGFGVVTPMGYYEYKLKQIRND